MTEAEWMRSVCITKMLYCLRERGDERTLGLFALGCCRRLELVRTDSRLEAIVRIWEDFWDASPRERRTISGTMNAICRLREEAESQEQGTAYRELSAFACASPIIEDGFERARQTSMMVAECLVARRQPCDTRAEFGGERVEHCELMRDLVPNPSRPIDVGERWDFRPECASQRMARAIYGERSYEDLPILADALEDDGCRSPVVLAHCREPGIHVRGCWVLELLLRDRYTSLHS